jgi:hypothetical protein
MLKALARRRRTATCRMQDEPAHLHSAERVRGTLMKYCVRHSVRRRCRRSLCSKTRLYSESVVPSERRCAALENAAPEREHAVAQRPRERPSPVAKSRLGRRIPRNGPNTRFAETAWWWRQADSNPSYLVLSLIVDMLRFPASREMSRDFSPDSCPDDVFGLTFASMFNGLRADSLRAWAGNF